MHVFHQQLHSSGTHHRVDIQVALAGWNLDPSLGLRAGRHRP